LDLNARRRERMAVLARADAGELKSLWGTLGPEPEHSMLRGPESGAITLRGRMGGGGAPFNVGEATVTRATVRLSGGAIGHGAMLGRDREKTRISALIDAMCAEPQNETRIEAAIIAPLRERIAAADEQVRRETAATKVNFFTMTRGED
jgi:alpha-D-ribose 1-methylphosphonate 5-triphosphate synthase subunit PhnG